jgi:phosphoribosyl 1,2-cyclic phosphodiesterase
VEYRGRRVMIDCGLDWLAKVHQLRPHAIVLTHAHPDHADGLRSGSPCPVFATPDTWQILQHFPIRDREVIESRRPRRIEGLLFEAFSVEHSLRCPAVGYRITAGRTAVFYVPDVVFIHERREALRGIRLYIGDGATIQRPLIRRRGKSLIGHTPIRTQLGWCRKELVPAAVITHCGSEIVTADARRINARIGDLARRLGVPVRVADDGMEIVLR